jgi:restriction endonuclease Mrr
VLAASVYGGYFTINKLLNRGVFTVKNAEKLLEINRPEEWNALRSLNSTWQPSLESKRLVDLDLTGVNLQRAKLQQVDFSRSIFDDADFSMSSASSVNFSNASLKRATFDNAVLTDVNFEGAILENTKFTNATFHETVVPETIVVDSQYSQTTDLLTKVVKDPHVLSIISPREFEALVTDALKRSGYEAELMGGPDKGIDIIAMRRDPLGEMVSIIQCKHYQGDRTLGISSVRALSEIRALENADRAILVTSGRFSSEAKDFAEHKKDIELIDREQFIRWLRNVSESAY